MARVLAVQELTPEEIELVSGGEDGTGSLEPSLIPSPDSLCQGKADDCQADELM
jgi:hypothetical protein